MEYREISDNYSVSGQILPDDIAALKAAGFKSVICNRPDNEQPGFWTVLVHVPIMLPVSGSCLDIRCEHDGGGLAVTSPWFPVRP